MSYPLNQNQKDHIENLMNAGDYHLAYRYIAEQIEDAVQSGQVSRETQRWFEWAEHINGDYDSFINNYARTYAKMGASADGITLTDEDFQAGSDVIAQEVLSGILNSGEVPTTPKDIILTDIATGSQEMGTDVEDFPGTLLANMLFDTDTLGELIFNDPNGTTWAEIAKLGEQIEKHLLLLAGRRRYRHQPFARCRYLRGTAQPPPKPGQTNVAQCAGELYPPPSGRTDCGRAGDGCAHGRPL